jgi:hypothetical protein
MTKVKVFFLLAVLGLTVGRMLAQTTTQGSISGTTYDVSHAVIPNATVRIVNSATNAVLALKSGDSGEFVAPLLEPGEYTVSINAPGFDTYRANHVIVQVGQSTHVVATLNVGSASTVVEVTAAVPVLNFESPDFSSNINSVAMENIPINNRRWSALALTTPGVTVDTAGFGLVSVRGLSTILNNVMIDGADDNQAYFSEERGRTREAYSTSGSAVREFQVNTGVYPAEFGRAAGGVINSVTKSGANKMHGEAYFSDRQSNWAAFGEQSTATTLVNGVNVTAPVKPEDLRKIYGFTAGGALIKDKLFWIYTYDQHTHIFPMLGAPFSPSTFYQQADALGATGDSACSKTTGYLPTTTVGVTTANSSLDQQICTLAARLSYSARTAYGANVTYSNALALFNSGISGPGSLSSDIGLIPRSGYQEINTPKVDWNINDKEHASFLYHRLRWDSPGGVQTVSTGKYGLNATGTDFVKLDYGVAKLISQVNPHISNELLYQYGRELNDEGLMPTTAYDQANIVENGNDPYIALDVTQAGFYVGAPYYGFRPSYPDERKWQIDDDLYYTRGKHTFKTGIDMVHNYDLTNQKQYYEGYFVYSSNLANYFADLYSKGFGTGTCNSGVSISSTAATSNAVGTYPCYSNYTQDYGPSSFDFSTMDQAYFVQDDWKILPRLTLQLGMRYDYERLPSAVPALTAASGNFVPFNGINNNPSDKNNFGPRVGFSYDVFGNSKTVLRGGYGLYYGRLTNGNQGVVLATTGSPLAQTATKVSKSNPLASLPIFPNTLSSTQLSNPITTAPSAYFRSPNLQNPQIDEFDLMVQRELGKGTVVQVSYLGALGRELPNFLDVNLNPTQVSETITMAPATGTTNYGPLGSASFTVPTFTGYGNTALLGPSATNFQAISEMVSNVNSNYNALSVEVQNRTMKSLQFDLNYTWAHALDFNQNASTAGATNGWYDPYKNSRVNYSNSTWDIRDRLVGYAIYSFPNIHGGTLVKYLTNDWKFDDSFQMQTGLPYSAGMGGQGYGILGYLNGNGSVTFAPQVGQNNYFQPRDIVDDVRLQKDVLLKGGIKLELIAQSFNVANHQNVTEMYTEAYNMTTATVAGVPTTTATYQGNFGTREQTNNSGFSYAPRQIEVSFHLFW